MSARTGNRVDRPDHRSGHRSDHRSAGISRVRGFTRAVAALATVIAVGAVAACSVAGARDDGVFRYQSTPGQVNAVQLADALGFLDGVDVELAGNVSGGPEALQALASGSVDLASTYNGALTKVVAAGLPVRGIVASYGFEPGYDLQLVVNGDSPITEARDLVGKRITVNTLGASLEAFVDTWLRAEGLTEEEIATVTYVPLPSISATEAIASGEVDAGVTYTNVLNRVPDGASFRTLLSYIEVNGAVTDGAWATSEKNIEQRPDQVRAIATGTGRAYDWLRANGGDAARQKLEEYFRAEGLAEHAEGLSFWDGTFGVGSPGGALHDEDFSRWHGWLIADEQVDGPIPAPREVYTNEFNDAAA